MVENDVMNWRLICVSGIFDQSPSALVDNDVPCGLLTPAFFAESGNEANKEQHFRSTAVTRHPNSLTANNVGSMLYTYTYAFKELCRSNTTPKD